jgi:hypothetical protein
MEQDAGLEDLFREKADFAYDGTIVAIFPDVVHVRLAGAPRRILTNVIVADHIDQEVLRVGMFVKLDGLYDRRKSKGRTILTDILPNINYEDYAGKGTGVPPPPIISVSADCDNWLWNISWSAVKPVTYYQLYWSASSDGSAPALLVDTVFREAQVVFDVVVPPKIYFAVRGVSGVNEGELSAWTTDFFYLNSSPLISFGDSYEHGHLTPTGKTRWRVSPGKVEKSTSLGAVWLDVTPATVTNDWSDSPAPTPADITYFQLLGDDSNLFLLGRWQNSGGLWRSFLWHSTDDLTWTGYSLLQAAETELQAIWAAYDITDSYLLVTFWADDELFIQRWDLPPSFDQNVSLGASTLTEFNARTYYAFPVSNNAGEYLIAGRFQTLPVFI